MPFGPGSCDDGALSMSQTMVLLRRAHDVALALVANMYSFMHFAIGHFDVYNKLYLMGEQGGR